MNGGTGVFGSANGGRFPKFVPPIGSIVHIRNPLPYMDEYRFEYHPHTQKVYLINISKTIQKNGQTMHEGEVLAEHCDTEARAFGFVQTWCRGHKEGQKSHPNLLSSNQ